MWEVVTGKSWYSHLQNKFIAIDPAKENVPLKKILASTPLEGTQMTLTVDRTQMTLTVDRIHTIEYNR
jgi:hypothetical protein